MGQVEKVSISLTQQHADVLRDAVESGAYASSSEVVREALRDWSAKWLARRADIEKLRALWAEGKASGPAVDIDFEEALAEARMRANSEVNLRRCPVQSQPVKTISPDADCS